MYCIVLCNTGMNTRWALTRRSLPDNRLIKTGGWALTQGWALARDNTVVGKAEWGGHSALPSVYEGEAECGGATPRPLLLAGINYKIM